MGLEEGDFPSCSGWQGWHACVVLADDVGVIERMVRLQANHGAVVG